MQILKTVDLLHDAGAITPEFHAQVHAASKDKPALYLTLIVKVLEIVVKVIKYLAERRKS
ncbi:hypothetical protein DRD23_08810 [Salmonella enterica subsp. enterica serovar Enteritidis]|jgi:hypothetical protein|nr:hypothetical protein [Salmonella enterica subsp. enterica serovar Enteritidis]